MKLDVLAVGAHPDDVELSCGGTVAKLVKQGRTVGILDLTRGELGTRGNEKLRRREAADSARILGVKIRENLELPDGNIEVSRKNVLRVITLFREYHPDVLLIPYSEERHPDHEHAHRLAKEAWYYSGLAKIKTRRGRLAQERHRPKYYIEYMQMYPFTPSFIVDISDVYELKVAAIGAFGSQFHNPQYKDRDTLLSRPQFLDFLETRAKYFGHLIGAKYGEPFYSIKPVGVENIFDLKVFKE
jgi:bacillithiol biosynthesis deacetylase BshB1